MKKIPAVLSFRRVRQSVAPAAFATVLLVAASTTCAANRVFLVNGNVLAFQSIEWRGVSKEYRITTAQSVLPVALKDVDHLEVDRPADFDKAAKMVEAGQNAAAIPILKAIADKYEMLVWDAQAAGLLGRAYIAQKDYSRAADAIETVLKRSKPDTVPLATLRAYWEALAGLKRNEDLRKALDAAIGHGTRPTAAQAYLVRAGVEKAAGKTEEAAADYLKIVLLFDNLTEVQAEALAGAAETLEALQDPRAQEMRTRLIKEFPSSPFAVKQAAK